MCYVLAFGIVLANIALECGQLVGAMSSFYVYDPEMEHSPPLRAFMATIFGIVVAAILLCGQVNCISKALGGVVLLMVVTFGVGAGQVFDWVGQFGQLLQHLIIPELPGAESFDIALGMIATTALPFNTFLASSLAAGCDLSSMQVGVAFSTLMAGTHTRIQIHRSRVYSTLYSFY